jgi:hypothetical protein
MSAAARVTVTLPAGVLERIDRLERNRSRFITEAIERELERRRRNDLLRSLRNPHPEGAELAELGFSDWSASLPDDEGLVDPDEGTPVQWIEGEGWVESKP